MERRRVVVHGQVQGVFFRDSCRRAAIERGVSGWVANRSNGTVEAVFEGSAADVAAMSDWCRQGPRFAVVDAVDVTIEEVVGETGFTIY